MCGHTIRDQSDSIPYKRNILPDKFYNNFFDKILSLVETLKKAYEDESLHEWVRIHHPNYGVDNIPTVFHDILHALFLDYEKNIYQCEKCGRIWLETEKNKYVSFKPEHEGNKNILNPNINLLDSNKEE